MRIASWDQIVWMVRSIVAWDSIVRISSFARLRVASCELYRGMGLHRVDCMMLIASYRLYRCVGSHRADCIVYEIALCELHYGMGSRCVDCIVPCGIASCGLYHCVGLHRLGSHLVDCIVRVASCGLHRADLHCVDYREIVSSWDRIVRIACIDMYL